MKFLSHNEQKLNDIIFANRNKKYGAYAIRSSYSNTMLKSLLIVSSTVFLTFGSIFIYTRVHEKIEMRIDAPNIPPLFKEVIMDLRKLDKTKPNESSSKKSSSGAPKSKAAAPLIVDSAQTVSTPSLNLSPQINPNPGPNSSLTGSGPDTGSLTGTGGSGTPGPDNDPTPMPDESPVFEGGLAALTRFIGQNISYPELAKEMGKEGKVYVSFVVNELEQVERVKLARGIGGGCDEEAIRVVNKIPKFKSPGKVKGKAVKVLFNVPIVFKLK